MLVYLDARRGHDKHGHLRVRVLHVHRGRARHHGGRAPAVVAPVVKGGMTGARAAAVDEQRGEPGLCDPLVARQPHAPPVLGHEGGPVRRVARHQLLALRLAVALQALTRAAGEPAIHGRRRLWCTSGAASRTTGRR